jgi:hypothetical protein
VQVLRAGEADMNDEESAVCDVCGEEASHDRVWSEVEVCQSCYEGVKELARVREQERDMYRAALAAEEEAAMSFAAKTRVSVERSKSEVEQLLSKYGAVSFASGWTSDGATIVFEMKNRRLRFELPIPSRKEFRAEDKWEQEKRRRWRCLVLAVKAKLEIVESGISTFEEEFLSHIIVPGTGETFGAWAAPQIATAYERGLQMPLLLGSGAGK